MSKGLIELLLVFGSVLALAVYELVSVRRSLRGGPPKGNSEPPGPQ